ncbi:type II toxin-antitoxin system PemK/MazF family toxin [Stappia sp. F7233]|uniref:Type II toxin-antitoxin system PemK/MazF family toxin n=1 Tax=Stappia albiluteola TaxID=2758565 RepID=A0A839AKX0_9HYPH|nr:type II toxin-antitoxin system PemK/MazF family toxin [Stappia albiluteola]MBA5779099.1 type II toxin-antitoxin system PemK/MazF family toxin [Stappia albiluteola]
MPLPDPKRGLVIRYSFLWSDERRTGATEGRKDRPCAIVISKKFEETGATQVTVVPITHAAPPQADRRIHLKLDDADCRKLGLDHQDHWVVLDELNRFEWPGYDLRPIPGTDRYDYGMLPQSTFQKIVQAIIDLDKERKATNQRRLAPLDRDA